MIVAAASGVTAYKFPCEYINACNVPEEQVLQEEIFGGVGGNLRQQTTSAIRINVSPKPAIHVYEGI